MREVRHQARSDTPDSKTHLINVIQYRYLVQPLGWDVAALSDVLLEYPDSCGSCIEVRCREAVISDNYGESTHRMYCRTDCQ